MRSDLGKPLHIQYDRWALAVALTAADQGLDAMLTHLAENIEHNWSPTIVREIIVAQEPDLTEDGLEWISNAVLVPGASRHNDPVVEAPVPPEAVRKSADPDPGITAALHPAQAKLTEHECTRLIAHEKTKRTNLGKLLATVAHELEQRPADVGVHEIRFDTEVVDGKLARDVQIEWYAEIRLQPARSDPA